MFRFSPPVTLCLQRGRLLAWQHQSGVRLRVLSGAAWVTQTHDPQDHFLQPGQVLELRPGSHALIGAEQDVSLSFEALSGRLWPAVWLRFAGAVASGRARSTANSEWSQLLKARAGLP